jgi:serine/threonine-protein kinase
MQITKALRAAHERGVIHRDMKPENVYLIQRDGRPDFVKVLDFGIAKVINPDETDGPRLTQTGMIFGTPEYMSPEQAQGQPPDHRVDVYAVGCIMYHLLTGAVPFTADNFMGILTKHLLETPVPPRQRRPDLDIPADVEAICLRAMEKDRDKRFADMDAFYRALGAVGGLPFEPSGVLRVRQQSPLATKPIEARPPAASGRGQQRGGDAGESFADERPVRAADAAPAGMGSGLKIGIVVAALAVAGAVVAFGMRGDKQTAASKAAVTAPAPAAPPVATPPAPQPAAAEVVVVPPSPPATEPAPAADGASGKLGRKHRRGAASEEPKPDPAHRQIDIPAEPTPAELKNPFNQ